MKVIGKDVLDAHRAALSENPVVRMRERLGYTRVDFAKRTGVPYSTLARAETGLANSLPRTVAQAAEVCGEDPAVLAGEYVVWVMRLREALRKEGES